MVQRGKDMNQSLKWEFPGGKIEEGESETECLIREINEVLSLVVNPTTRLTSSIFHYPNISIELIPFICELKGGEITLSEHKQYKWLETDELQHIDWAEADIPIMKEYIRRKL